MIMQGLVLIDVDSKLRDCPNCRVRKCCIVEKLPIALKSQLRQLYVRRSFNKAIGYTHRDLLAESYRKSLDMAIAKLEALVNRFEIGSEGERLSRCLLEAIWTGT